MSEFVTVDISHGRLRGKKVTSSTSGLSYCSFQGIPYAKPPLGPLRFKAPEEPEPWTGTRDATQEGAVSVHLDFSGKMHGNEDCLFLNVYVPQWPVKSKKAVMVWIHGGGFIFGSGNTDTFGPDFLMAEDVILVTLNYRLGLLGFLNLEHADVTANNGLRDQIMALKWVRNNISEFGGDPDNVTIFGESAGGFSVHFLMLTPLAAGLFHRAIIQSGTAMLPRCIVPRDVTIRRCLRLAKILGCTSEDHKQVVAFLRAIPAEQIATKQMEALKDEADDVKISIPPFLPCEESGPDALLPDNVTTLLEEGRFTKVPLIIGITSGEGKVLVTGASSISETAKNFQAVIPQDLDPVPNTERTREIADSIRKFYFGDMPLDEHAVPNYINLQTDMFFTYPMHRVVLQHLRWSPHPTYVYLFDRDNPEVISTFPIIRNEYPGAPHAAELPYLFQSSVNPNKFVPGSENAHVQFNMVKLWTQFAKTGKPSNEAENLIWTPATKEKYEYLKINNGFHMQTNIYQQRTEFLTDLYKKYLPTTKV